MVPEDMVIASARGATDPSELARHLKSQLLSGEKVLNKNQRKKARKKVTKLLQKTLGLTRTNTNPADSDSEIPGQQQAKSDDTGCSNRPLPGPNGCDPANTSTHTAQLKGAPHSKAATQAGARAAAGQQGKGAAAGRADGPTTAVESNCDGSRGTERSSKRRRLDPRIAKPPLHPHRPSAADDHQPGLGGAAAAAAAVYAQAGSDVAAAGRPARPQARAPSGAAAASADRLSGGTGLTGGSSRLSHGAQKRLSRRQAQPEDLLLADDDAAADMDAGGAGESCRKGRGPVVERSADGSGMGVAAGGERGRRDRRQRARARRQDIGRGSGGGGGIAAASAAAMAAATAAAESSLVAAASEEVVQIPRVGGTAAATLAAAGAAVTAVHRGGGYVVYGSAVAAIASAPPLLPPPLAGPRAHGPVDLSAALLMMRVQLRASATASAAPSCEGQASGDAAVDAQQDEASADSGGLGEGGGRGVGGASPAEAGMGSLRAPATAAPAPGQQAGCKGAPAAGQQPAAAKAGQHRFGNYHRYYGYRLGQELDEDPRVKLMRREWFQNKVCVDVGCNEGLVTLAVAARFGAKRMTGYDIDGALIKRACTNLRVMRSEYTTRLQALTLGPGSQGGSGFSEDVGGGSDQAAGSRAQGGLEGISGAPSDQDGPLEGPPEGQLPECGDEGAAPKEMEWAGAEEALQVPEEAQAAVAQCGGSDGEDEDENEDEGEGTEAGDAGDGTAAGNGHVAEEAAGAAGPRGGRGGSGHEGKVGDGAGGGTDTPSCAAPAGAAAPGPQHPSRKAAQSRGPYRAVGPAPPPRVGVLRSYVRALAGTFFVQQDWANARGRPESADTILCLSVTKWVHLNNGDAGLKKLFKKCFDTLNPGGLLLLEPQPWKSYKRAVHKTTTSAVPFRRIEQLQLRPQHFLDYLTGQVGFVLEARLNEGGEGGFDRPMYLLRKPATPAAAAT